MRIAIIIPLMAASLLAGCATITGPVEVTRFNRAAEGQDYGKGSFIVKAAFTQPGSELSMSPYLTAVRQEMQRAGYTDAGGSSAMGQGAVDSGAVIAEVNITTEYPETQRGRSPVSVGVGGSTGSYRSGVGIGVGLDITNLINKPKPQVVRILSVRILNVANDSASNAANKSVIWEGKARQQSSAGTPAAQPGIAAAKLASALFAGFPGTSGETITVK